MKMAEPFPKTAFLRSDPMVLSRLLFGFHSKNPSLHFTQPRCEEDRRYREPWRCSDSAAERATRSGTLAYGSEQVSSAETIASCSSAATARLSLNRTFGHWFFGGTGHGRQLMSSAKS